MIVMWLALAGSAGAVARFVVDGAVRTRCATAWPVGTLLINVTGSVLIGVLTGLVLFHGSPSALTTVAGTGFCGGYTTFSTASFETVRLLQQRRYVTAALSAAGGVLLPVAGAALGLLVTA